MRARAWWGLWLSLCQFCTVSIPVAFSSIFETGSVSPPTVYFFIDFWLL